MADGMKPPPPGLEETFPPSNGIRQAVADTECLLSYAAETGTEIPGDQVDAILATRVAVEQDACTRAGLASFYAAFTKIAAKLAPVNADTIRACTSKEAAQNLERNGRRAVILTVVIVILSILAFVDNAISSKISSQIAEINAAAVKLRSAAPTAALGDIAQTRVTASDRGACEAINRLPTGEHKSPGLDDITQLQQFAAGLRNIYGNTIKLNYFVAKIEDNPLLMRQADGAPPNVRDQLQLNPALLNFEAEVVCKISTYEQVRDFAQNVALDNSVFFGALAVYILPVAYALLGAMAYRLRTFADTIRKRTYHPSYADSARLIAALIAGSIVSLFNNFTQGVSLSPLALAFLVGYGVEIFFTFIDTILNSFGSAGPRKPTPVQG